MLILQINRQVALVRDCYINKDGFLNILYFTAPSAKQHHGFIDKNKHRTALSDVEESFHIAVGSYPDDDIVKAVAIYLFTSGSVGVCGISVYYHL